MEHRPQATPEIFPEAVQGDLEQEVAFDEVASRCVWDFAGDHQNMPNQARAEIVDARY